MYEYCSRLLTFLRCLPVTHRIKDRPFLAHRALPQLALLLPGTPGPLWVQRTELPGAPQVRDAHSRTIQVLRPSSSFRLPCSSSCFAPDLRSFIFHQDSAKTSAMGSQVSPRLSEPPHIYCHPYGIRLKCSGHTSVSPLERWHFKGWGCLTDFVHLGTWPSAWSSVGGPSMLHLKELSSASALGVSWAPTFHRHRSALVPTRMHCCSLRAKGLQVAAGRGSYLCSCEKRSCMFSFPGLIEGG